MVLLNISAAARAAGHDRSTIQRYIKSGKLSASVDAAGRAAVDTSELLRVFGELKKDGAAVQQAHGAAISQDAADIIAALRRELEEAKERERMAIAREREANDRELWYRARIERLELLSLPQGDVQHEAPRNEPDAEPPKRSGGGWSGAAVKKIDVRTLSGLIKPLKGNLAGLYRLRVSG